jgi:hypothetical protein
MRASVAKASVAGIDSESFRLRLRADTLFVMVLFGLSLILRAAH